MSVEVVAIIIAGIAGLCAYVQGQRVKAGRLLKKLKQAELDKEVERHRQAIRDRLEEIKKSGEKYERARDKFRSDHSSNSAE